MGMFLQVGMTVIGDNKSMIVYNGNTKFLECYPCQPSETTYYVDIDSMAVMYALPALCVVYKSDYDIVHCCMRHPSKDALHYMCKHISNLPGFEIPAELPQCPACKQAKMPQRSFPTAPYRATRHFDLIHSNLKELPVISYHKYKWIITFIDDDTSYA